MVRSNSVAAVTASVFLSGLVHGWIPQLPSCLDEFQPFVYTGCFQDKINSTATLPFAVQWSNPDNMTVEACVAECKGNGYRYAGLEYYFQCFCGATVDGPQVDDSQCDYPCWGNTSEICGGYSLLSVYEDPTFEPIDTSVTSDYAYLGCWSDDSTIQRALTYLQDLDTTTMTTEICLQTCKDGGYPFAGTEYSGECWCGVVIGNGTSSAPSTDCSYPCSGNSSEICGGSSRLSLYVAQDLLSLEPCGYNETTTTTTTSSSVVWASTITASTFSTSTLTEASTSSSTTTECPCELTSSTSTIWSSASSTEASYSFSTSSVSTVETETSSSMPTAPSSSWTSAPSSMETSTSVIPSSSTESCSSSASAVSTVETSTSSVEATTSSVETTSSYSSTFSTVTTMSRTTSSPSRGVTSTTKTGKTWQITSTTTSALCVATTTVPGSCSCEWGCGSWCSSPLPDWDDDVGCKLASAACELQVASCFLLAGWPSAAKCFEFSAWCTDIDDYCTSSCSRGCSKKECVSNHPASGGTPCPSVTSTFAVPCTATSVPKPSPTTTTKCIAPTPTNLCTQPDNDKWGYAPGKPVGGVAMPYVTCNDDEDEWGRGDRFKLFSLPDSAQCPSSPTPMCDDACQSQHDSCISVYAAGCRDNTWGLVGGLLSGILGSSNTYDAAVSLCVAQLDDCKAKNKEVTGDGKCGQWCSGW